MQICENRWQVWPNFMNSSNSLVYINDTYVRFSSTAGEISKILVTTLTKISLSTMLENGSAVEILKIEKSFFYNV